MQNKYLQVFIVREIGINFLPEYFFFDSICSLKCEFNINVLFLPLGGDGILAGGNASALKEKFASIGEWFLMIIDEDLL